MLQVSQIGSSTGHEKPEMTGLDKSRIGAWKKGGLTKAEIMICEKVAEPQMLEHGYRPSHERANPLEIVLLKASLPLKLAFAGLVNLNRVSNLRQAVARRLN